MYHKLVSFLPSQIDTPQSTSAFITTISPLTLIYSDVVLCFRNFAYLPGIVFPMTPFGSGTLDEFYPSAPNLWAMLIHAVLVCIELAFVLSVPFFVFFVGAGCVAYCGITAIIVSGFCLCLNGRRSHGNVSSNPKIMDGYDKREDEIWVFVNGVAVG